jgi:lysophospholipase L1-like esterase
LRHPSIVYRLGAVLFTLGVILTFDFGSQQVYRSVKKNWLERRSGAGLKPPALKSAFRCSHPVYHHGFVPNSSRIEYFGPIQTEYFINSGGFRDGKIRTVYLDSPQPRVLILGDSYAEGVGVPWAETAVGRVAAALAPQGIEVLNGAVASYCPSLMLAKLKELYKKERLRADLVVAFIDISDIEDELKYEAQPGGGFSLAETSPFDVSWRWTWDKKLCDWLEVRVEKNFTLLGALSRNVRQFWRKAGSVGGTAELKRASWTEYQGPSDEVIAEGLTKAEQSMDGILELVRAHRAELLVVIYPWLEQVNSGKSPSRAETFWEDWCQHHQVALLNFFPRFVPMGKSYEKRFCITNDGHWNAAGHARVAEELLPAIEQILSARKSTD